MRQPRTNATPGQTAKAAAGLLAAALLTGCAATGGGPRTDPSTTAPAGLRDDPTAYAEAVAAARARFAAAPAEPYWPYRLAACRVAVDSLDAARADLDRALTLDPDYAPAVSLLSEIHYRRGDHAAAAALLTAYLGRHPDAPDALRADLAVNLAAQGDEAAAESALADCRGDDAGLAGVRAFVLLKSDHYLDALEPARRAVAADPGSAAAHNNLGICLLYAGRPAEAREAFTAALDRDPQLPGALYNLAIVTSTYFFDRDAGRAWFERYRQVAAADPDGLADLLADKDPGTPAAVAAAPAASGAAP